MIVDKPKQATCPSAFVNQRLSKPLTVREITEALDGFLKQNERPNIFVIIREKKSGLLRAVSLNNKEQIEKQLEWVRGKVTEDLEEYDITLPRVVVEMSHLGKGMITFFICPPCQKKVRSVYLINKFMACRNCHKLTYKKQTRRQTEIIKLIKNDQLRELYLSSWQSSKAFKALEAEAALDRIKKAGYTLGDEIAEVLVAQENSVTN